MIIELSIIAVCVVAIYKFSEALEEGATDLGRYFRMSSAVMGATLLAVASSFAEFCTVISGLVIHGSFEVGVGAIGGSALFNLLIPAFVVAGQGTKPARPHVVRNMGGWYLFTAIALILALWLSPEGKNGHVWHFVPWWVGALFVIKYIVRIVHMVKTDTSEKMSWIDGVRPNLKRAVGHMVLGMTGVGVACHFMVDAALEVFVNHWGLSAMACGVTILAVATSVPDALVSYFAAKKGEVDAAFANAFGSNEFDIDVCLGLPIALTVFGAGGLMVNWGSSWQVLAVLLGSTIVTLGFMRTEWKLRRSEAAVMLIGYVLFCAAVFMGCM